MFPAKYLLQNSMNTADRGGTLSPNFTINLYHFMLVNIKKYIKHVAAEKV